MASSLQVFLIILVLVISSYIVIFQTIESDTWLKTQSEWLHGFFQVEVKPIPGEKYPITFISAFFNIGKFRKWNGMRGMENYIEMMRAYRRLNSPMVIYSNDPVFLLEASLIREKYKNITKVIFIENIYNLTGFKHYNKTKTLFESPHYPKVNAVTTNAKYCCVMHSKYDLVEMSIKNDYFKTPYFAWVDIGYMRHMGGDDWPLNVTLPPEFNDSKIAVNKVYEMYPEVSTLRVMTGLSIWVGGGFYLGKPSLLLKFVRQYRRFVDRMIAIDLMATDENIIYAMYLHENYTPDMVEFQFYSGHKDYVDKCDFFFHMMYLLTNHSCLGSIDPKT